MIQGSDTCKKLYDLLDVLPKKEAGEVNRETEQSITWINFLAEDYIMETYISYSYCRFIVFS